MKILFYISTIRGGGAARVMVNIANGLSQKGYDICFVTNFSADHEYELSDAISRISLEETEIKGNFFTKNMSRVAKLRKTIRKEKPAVCIAFMRENNYRLILSAAGLPTKTIVSVRNDPRREYGKKGNRALANLLFSKSDGVVFQTEDAKAFFPESIQRKSRIIFNQVDEKFFHANSIEGQYIVACGRLSKQKNYPMMLNAFAKVLAIHPDEELQIYGEGKLKEELISFADELGISDSVHFMGFSTEMGEVYKNAKMLIMTSDYEGMPNIMLEALASSVPVISTDCPCGGPRMVIRDGENGYLVPVGDYLKLAEKIADFLSQKSKCVQIKENAYHTGELFSPTRILQEWINMISYTCND